MLPSRELTYPPKWHFEDDFPFPKVGYVNSLEGIHPKGGEKTGLSSIKSAIITDACEGLQLSIEILPKLVAGGSNVAQFLLKSGRDYIEGQVPRKPPKKLEVPKGFPKQYPYNLISSKSIKNHIDPFARNLLSTSKVAGKKKTGWIWWIFQGPLLQVTQGVAIFLWPKVKSSPHQSTIPNSFNWKGGFWEHAPGLCVC